MQTLKVNPCYLVMEHFRCHFNQMVISDNLFQSPGQRRLCCWRQRRCRLPVPAPKELTVFCCDPSSRNACWMTEFWKPRDG